MISLVFCRFLWCFMMFTAWVCWVNRPLSMDHTIWLEMVMYKIRAEWRLTCEHENYVFRCNFVWSSQIFHLEFPLTPFWVSKLTFSSKIPKISRNLASKLFLQPPSIRLLLPWCSLDIILLKYDKFMVSTCQQKKLWPFY